MPTTNVVPGSHEELEQIARSISKSRKVVVITGAGISTNLGIPDFRSDNGLYSLIQEQYNKFNDHLEKSNKTETEQNGPRKRRKLDRSQSLGSSETLNNGAGDLTILRRSLRSAKSSSGFEDAPSTNDEEPQKSTIRASRYGSPSDIPTSLPEVPKNILSNVKGKDLFDAVIWQDKKSTETHYTFITSLKHKIDEVKDTSEVHKFIRVLRDGGKLVRNYTQNIDMLEAREGLCTDMTRGTGSRGRFNPKLRKEAREGNDHEGGIFDSGVEVVQLHGNLERLRCQLCLALTDWETDNRHLSLLAGKAPPCPKCVEKTEKRIENNRRGLSVGTLRPDIVLYGESNPHEQVIGDLSTHDIMLGPDMLIILGTSLKVHGLKLLLKEFAKAVHTKGGTVVFVNNTKPPDSIWGDVIDFWVEWDCDEWVRDVKARREDIWMPWGTSREPSPKPSSSHGSQISTAGPVAVPKNPQSMRTDFNCAAYQWDKILRALREKSGRMDCPEETERRAHAERINAARAADGKAFTAKLVAEAARSRPVTKQPAAAQKPAPKLAVVVKIPPPAHVPPLHIARLPEYASWKPPSRQPENQYLPPSPIQIAADRPAAGKRKRERRPAAVREDKNNNAHHQWETIRLINKTSGSQRVLPDMATARQTFFQENRRAGSGIMEMPPPARPTTPRMTLRVSPVVPDQNLPAPVPSSPLITFRPPSPVVSHSITPNFAPAFKPSPKITFEVPSPVVSNAATPAPMAISQHWPRRISRVSPPSVFMPITSASVPCSAPSSSNVPTVASMTGTMQMTSSTPISPPRRERTRASDARPRSVPSPMDNTDGLDDNWAIPVGNIPFGHDSQPSGQTKAPHLQPSHIPIADPALEARRKYIHACGDPCWRGIHSIHGISERQDTVTLFAWDDPKRTVVFERGQNSFEGRPTWDVPTASPAFSDRSLQTAGQGDHYVIPYDLGRAEMFRDAEQSQNTPSDGSVQKPALYKPLHFLGPTFTPEMQMEVVGPRIRAEYEGQRHDWSGHKYATPIRTDGWDAEWGTQRPRCRPFEQLPTPAMTPQTSTIGNGACNGGGAIRSWNSWSYTPAPSSTSSYPTPANSQESVSGSGSSDRDSPQLPSLKFVPPMTPKTRRIKNLGSISSILSSPPPAPPTLSKESETLLEISDTSPPRYPPPYANDQQKLWPGYPDLDKRLTKRGRRMMRRN